MLQVPYNPPENSYHLGYESEYEGYVTPVPPIIEKSAPEEKKPEKTGQTGKEQYKSPYYRLEDYIYWQEKEFYKNLYKKLVKDLTLTDDEVVEAYWNHKTEHSFGGYEYPIEAMQGIGEHKRQRKAEDTLEKSMGRLLGIVNDATRYNLHASHLDLDPACENPLLFYDKENIQKWRDAIEVYVPLPYYCKLQVGWHFGENRIHPHIVSSKPEGKLASIKSKKVVKKMYEAEGFIEYVQNVGLPWNKRNLKIRVGGERVRNALRIETKKRIAVPRTAWFSKGLPNSRTWNKA